MKSDITWNPLSDAPDRWTFVEVRYADGSTGRAMWSGVWQIDTDRKPVGWRYFEDDTEKVAV